MKKQFYSLDLRSQTAVNKSTIIIKNEDPKIIGNVRIKETERKDTAISRNTVTSPKSVCSMF